MADPLEDVEALFEVGKAASRAAHAAPGESADALALAEAVFSLGAKLFDERCASASSTPAPNCSATAPT